jgi:FkbH-like protein
MFKTLVVSDFNDTTFSNILKKKKICDLIETPFGQVQQVLLDKKWWDVDIAIIWTQPEKIIPTFRDVLEYKEIDIATILKEVDDYVDLVHNSSEGLKAVFVPAWVISPRFRGYGILNNLNERGVRTVLARMNLRLSEKFEKTNVYLLDAERWISVIGENSFSKKLWYMTKNPFSLDLLKYATNEIRSAIIALTGGMRKLIILDLDDTLWGGLVGDDGWENLKLGGHDPKGESFVEFQRVLKNMMNKGILLAIVSKNDEAVALNAIRKHPEMILKEDDFVTWRINWDDKSKNISEIVDELNLGMQSVVFIDDNPFERGRVSEIHREVLVPDWPIDKLKYVDAFMELNCFDSSTISSEDSKRASMYATEKKRENLKTTFNSVDDWLKTINIKVEIEKLGDSNIIRTVQLLNKTNQMNLTTRRLTETELVDWLMNEDRLLYTFKVSDKYGDMGLTGIISAEKKGDFAQIVDFILSCRVMGRHIEHVMISYMLKKLKGIKTVEAKYIETKKNKPTLRFWEQSGFKKEGDIFSWDLIKNYISPKHITIIDK